MVFCTTLLNRLVLRSLWTGGVKFGAWMKRSFFSWSEFTLWSGDSWGVAFSGEDGESGRRLRLVFRVSSFTLHFFAVFMRSFLQILSFLSPFSSVRSSSMRDFTLWILIRGLCSLFCSLATVCCCCFWSTLETWQWPVCFFSSCLFCRSLAEIALIPCFVTSSRFNTLFKRFLKGFLSDMYFLKKLKFYGVTG